MGKGQNSEETLWCSDRIGFSPQCSSKAPSLGCFWKQPLSTTRLSSRQVLGKHMEGSNHSTQMLKDDLICEVYLQEPCSLNKRFLPWLQEFRCYHFLSGGAHFTLNQHTLFILLQFCGAEFHSSAILLFPRGLLGIRASLKLQIT